MDSNSKLRQDLSIPVMPEIENVSEGSGLDIPRLLLVFRKSWLFLLILLILPLVGSYLYLRWTKDVFESSAVLKMNVKTDAGDIGLDLMGNGMTKSIMNLSGEIEILNSEYIREAVIKRVGLDVSFYTQGNVLNDEKYGNSPFLLRFDDRKTDVLYDCPIYFSAIDQKTFNCGLASQKEWGADEQVYQFGDTVSIAGFSFVVEKTNKLTEEFFDEEFFCLVHSPETLRNYFKENLLVEILNLNANTIKVSFKDHNRFKARDIVNAVNEVYLQKTIEAKQEVQEQMIAFINGQLDTASRKLFDAEMRLENFVRREGTVSPTGDLPKVQEEIASVEKEKEELRAYIHLLDDLQDFVQSGKAIEQSIPVVSGVENHQLTEEIGRLNELYKEMVKLEATTASKSLLSYQKKQAEIEVLQKSVLGYIEKDRILSTQQLAILSLKRKELDKMLQGLPSKETELTRIKRLYDLYEKYYLMLIEKRVEFGIQKAGTVPEFVTLATASLPKASIYPIRNIVYGIGLLLGMIFSVLFVVVRYFLQDTVLTQKDLERMTSAPVLGAIPKYVKEELDVSRLVVNKNPKSALSEAIRSLRTNIDFMAPKKKDRLISVTSTISGEGKTFVAINLAGVKAMSSLKVVLLDLDMRKPKVHMAFQAPNLKGMSTYLIGQHSLDECIQGTPLDNFDFIPAGPTPPNPSELILRPEFDELLERLFERYDLVVVDTPPVGLVTDGLLVMKRADVPIYVVRSGYSKRNVARNINNLLRSKRYQNLSVVLNSVDAMQGYGAYGKYGYGYGYGYYEEDAKAVPFYAKLFR